MVRTGPPADDGHLRHSLQFFKNLRTGARSVHRVSVVCPQCVRCVRWMSILYGRHGGHTTDTMGTADTKDTTDTCGHTVDTQQTILQSVVKCNQVSVLSSCFLCHVCCVYTVSQLTEWALNGYPANTQQTPKKYPADMYVVCLSRVCHVCSFFQFWRTLPDMTAKFN